MIHRFFEQQVAQNTALGAFAVWEAILAYNDAASRQSGLPLDRSFIILPLVFHRKTAEVIATKQMTDGSFLRAVAEHRLITGGLQSRMMSLFDETTASVNLAAAAGLITIGIDPPRPLLPSRRSLPAELPKSQLDPSVATILAASRRVGFWLATTPFDYLCNLLRIRF